MKKQGKALRRCRERTQPSYIIQANNTKRLLSAWELTSISWIPERLLRSDIHVWSTVPIAENLVIEWLFDPGCRQPDAEFYFVMAAFFFWPVGTFSMFQAQVYLSAVLLFCPTLLSSSQKRMNTFCINFFWISAGRFCSQNVTEFVCC